LRRHQGSDRLSFLAEINPLVPEGGPFRDGWRSEESFYKEFVVRTSLGFMSLKALVAAMRGMAHSHLGLRPAGGPLGLPADFLIAPSGRINAGEVRHGRLRPVVRG
jgi:hypothetical protein